MKKLRERERNIPRKLKGNAEREREKERGGGGGGGGKDGIAKEREADK